jgi:hypothetical protein
MMPIFWNEDHAEVWVKDNAVGQVGCMPYALEHDRGFAGDKLYRVVKRLPDGGFVRILSKQSAEQLGPFYKRKDAIDAVKEQYAIALR